MTLPLRPFGKTGLAFPLLSMGCGFPFGFGGFDQAIAAVRRAYELGIRYFDNAPLYRSGAAQAIVGEALADIPGGPIIDPKARLRGFRPKAGEAYGRIEAPKGELGFYLISDGSPNPYRYRVRPPSFINLTILEDMCLGHSVADVVVILGSVDIVLGEVDR